MIVRIINYLKNKINKIKFKIRRNKVIRNWKKSGKPLPPPPAYKNKVISEYRRKSKYKIFIETGTYLGDTVYSQVDNFSRIYSIELGEELYKKAAEKFQNIPHVKIFHGDSGKVLNELMTRIEEPAIFWLDGHYSGDITAKGEKVCPIYDELESISNARRLKHILLIDDARLFVGENDYPTIKELSAYILAKYPGALINIEDDIIRVELN